MYRLRIPGGRAHLLNTYLWLAHDGVTLVDTGWPHSAAVIADAPTELGRRREDVIRIVLTHFHEDLTGACERIAAATDPFADSAAEGDLS